MSNDKPTDNVLAFPGTIQPQFTKASPVTEDESRDELRKARLLAVAAFAEYLVENAEDIDNFVACVAARGTDSQIAYKIFVSPIMAADYSMAIKILEYSFLRSLEPEYFT